MAKSSQFSLETTLNNTVIVKCNTNNSFALSEHAGNETNTKTNSFKFD